MYKKMQFCRIKRLCIQGVLIILCLNLGACDSAPKVNELFFSLQYKNNSVDCNSPFSFQKQLWEMKQFQFFISNISLKNKQGDWQLWSMQKNAHQSENVALLGQYCNANNREKSQYYKTITFLNSVDLSQYTHIRFTLGVPFSLNHKNPLTQNSPLNDSTMFWVWQTGHKFLRAELATKHDNWLFHLGSTGCSAASVVRAPTNACKNPNKVNVELPLLDHKSSTLMINLLLEKLLHKVKLTNETSCQSQPDNKNCQQLFNNLGMGLNYQHSIFEVASDA